MKRLRLVVIVAGVALALVAVRLDDRRATWAAIAVLGLALALRFAVPRERRDHDADDPDALP